MKPTRALLAHAVIASIAITGLAIAQQGGDEAPETPPMPDLGAYKMVLGDYDIAQGWEKMASNAQPREPHEFLAKMAGTYSCTLRMWAGPDAQNQPPMESRGQAWIEPVLGGRFMQMKFAAAMMGQPFEGLGYLGFDNSRRIFTSSWMDTMSTSTLYMTGSINREGDQINLFGAADEPALGEYGKIIKYTYNFVDDDTFIFRAWEVQYGDPWKVIEIEYRRKPAGQPAKPANNP